MEQKCEQGFSLLELVVILVAGGILISASVSLYQKFSAIHQRQQRVILLERELSFIQLKLAQSLTTLPGRELGYYSGINYSVADLPANGMVDSKPIKLGVVTPFKINGNDAVTIIYGRRNAPRMELAETSGPGMALVAVPELAAADWDPAALFKIGDLMLLVGGPPSSTAKGNVQAVARVVRLTAAPVLVQGGKPQRYLSQFQYDFCARGVCGSQFPQLTNTTNQVDFGVGSALVPLNIASFYLAKGRGGSLVMRNDGGAILPSANGREFQVVGGNESFLGEADSLKISYLLEDGSERPTPDSPLVDWLKEVVGVKVELSRTVPSPIGSEKLTRTLKADFPLQVRMLD